MKKKKPSKKDKIRFYVIYFLCSCWVFYTYAPSVIFYYSQVKGIAEISFIKKRKFEMKYFNEIDNQQIRATFNIKTKKDKEKLLRKKRWNIIYSKYDKEMFSITDIGNKPHPFGLLLIIPVFLSLFLIPNHYRNN